MRLIAIDEAGRGPVIGPFVMCGVQLKEEANDKLTGMGVKDSKKLSHKQREFLYDLIKTVIEKYHLVIYTAEQLDEMMSNGINLNAIEAKATIEILTYLDGEKAYIDCPSTNIAKYTAQLRSKLTKPMELIAEHKADETYVSVGAASILAKVTRDREMEKLQQQYGDVGSGYPSDPTTKKFLEENLDKCPQLFRHHWEPCEKANDRKQQRRLLDF